MRRGFVGVGEGVPVVQKVAHATVELILLDVALLDAQRRGDDLFDDGPLALQPRHEGGEVLKFRLAGDEVEFDRLAEPTQPISLRKRVQEREIHANRVGWIKGAQLVLEAVDVDRAFGTDAAVALGEQRGGIIDPPHAAHEVRRDEATDILHHSTPDDDERASALEAGLEHTLNDGADGQVGFRLLRGVDQAAPLRRKQPRWKMPGHPVIGDDEVGGGVEVGGKAGRQIADLVNGVVVNAAFDGER